MSPALEVEMVMVAHRSCESTDFGANARSVEVYIWDRMGWTLRSGYVVWWIYDPVAILGGYGGLRLATRRV